MQTKTAQFVRAILNGRLTSSARTGSVAAGDEARILKGHSAGVFAVALSRDGQTLASASADNTVKLWDVGTGALLTTLSKESSVVSAIALSSSGSNLATGNHEGQITIWDSAPGEDPTTLSGHRGVVRCLAYSSNDVWLASGGSDRTIRIWSAKTRELKWILEGHTRGVFCLAFSPDGKTLASGSSDETVKIWNLERGTDETPDLLRQRAKRGVLVSLDFSPDGKDLAIATPDVVEVWDAVHSQRRFDLPRREKGSVWWSARYSPQGGLIAIGTAAKYSRAIRINTKKGISTGSHQPQDEEIRLWNAQTKQEIGHLSGHHDSVRAVALSADGTTLVSGSRDQTVRIWDLTRIRKPRNDSPVGQIVESNDGRESRSNFDGSIQASDVRQPSSVVDSGNAQRDAFQALQHLTEHANLDPGPGMQPLDLEQADPAFGGTWIWEDDDGSCFFWDELIGLIQIKDLRPSLGSGANKESGRSVTNPIVRKPLGPSGKAKTASLGSEFRSKPSAGVVPRDPAGWSRRESYHPASTSFSGSGTYNSGGVHDRTLGGSGGGHGSGDEHRKKDR